MTTVTVFDSPTELGATLASEIADGIAAAAAAGRRYVLGCPGGRSPRPVYSALAAEVARRQLEIGHLVIAMMDEYVERIDGEYRNVDPAASFSCARFAIDEVAHPLQSASSGGEPAEVWLPDATRPDQHEARIAASGVDLFILASGSSDGHVAFNPPGTDAAERCRVVELPDSTRGDNVRTHPSFGALENVPHFGVTVGPATIADYSFRAVLVAHGPEKRGVAEHLRSTDGYDPTWPSSVLHICRSPAFYLDVAADRS